MTRGTDGAGATAGFTLVEMLIALTIFATLMGAIAALFVSSLKAVKQGYQSMDAFEIARGTFSVIESDLSTAFTAREHGDYYNFYGTPIGMTFVGTAANTPGSRAQNISRVTYVLHQDFVTTVTTINETTEQTYSLIRYVEPGAQDLDTFTLPDQNNDGRPDSWGEFEVDEDVPLKDLLDAEVRMALSNEASRLVLYDGVMAAALDDEALRFDSNAADISPVARVFLDAKRRELWIRMLAGQIPGFWRYPDLNDDTDLRPNPLDYVVAEGIRSIQLPQLPFDLEMAPPFFTYGRLTQFDRSDGIDNDDDGFVDEADEGGPADNIEMTPYWNADRNVDLFRNLFIPQTLGDRQFVRPGLGTPMVPRIPVVVGVRLEWLFESPYPGAPDFNRVFDQTIDVPTGYTRLDLTRQ